MSLEEELIISRGCILVLMIHMIFLHEHYTVLLVFFGSSYFKKDTEGISFEIIVVNYHGHNILYNRMFSC